MNFYKPESLPPLMVAPNGARPSKKDHPAVPVTISETVETAKACFKSGATGIHFHIRDEKGEHILDSATFSAKLVDAIYNNTFNQNAAIYGKVYFPRITIPIANVIISLLQFFIQFFSAEFLYQIF